MRKISGTTSALFCALALAHAGCDKAANDTKSTDPANQEQATDDGTDSGTIPPDPAKPGTVAIGIGALPNVIDPVGVAANDKLDAQVESFDAPTGTLQVDAMNLMQDSGVPLNKKFDVNGISFGACEMANRARGFLASASEADFTTCILNNMVGSEAGFYDGKEHIVAIGGDNGMMKLKFTVTGTLEKVTGLKFQMCEGSTQTTYLEKLIAADGTFTIKSRGFAEPDNPDVDTVKTQLEVEGKLDGDLKFVGLKKIFNSYENQFSGGGSNYVREQVVQSSKNFQISGFSKESDPTRSASYLGYASLADTNTTTEPYELAKIMLGDGAMAYKKTDSFLIQGWNGGTKAVDNQNTYVGRVNGSKDSVPAIATTVESFDYEADQVWDCSGEPEMTLTMQELMTKLGSKATSPDSEDFGVCSRFSLDQNIHLECHSVTDTTSL
jgi:hypothetical protein